MSSSLDCKSPSKEQPQTSRAEALPRANPSAPYARDANLARAGLIVAAGIFGLSAACNPNVSGDLKAARLGDLTHALTARSDGAQPIDEACRTALPDPAAATPFHRRPFLQQMTDRSVRVDWVSATDPAAGLVVTKPDGSPVATVTAIADESAPASETTRNWMAAMAGLAPDTTYCYEVRGGDALWARAGFHTAPAAGQNRPIRFVAFGDSGTGSSDQLAAYEQMRTVPFDFLIHTGDVGYGSGTNSELQSYFFDIYADALARFPSFPTSGNHEYNSADATPFRQAFDLPTNGGPGGLERWYSFDWGDAHLVSLDTERMGTVQADWLEADLAANHLRWTIVYGHKPPYSSGDHGSDGTFQKYFVPILERHHVDLVLSGHDHDYERTNTLNGITYLVTGGGGAGTRSMGASSFTAFGDAVINVVYVTIEGNTLTAHAIDGTGEEFDSLQIAR